MTSDGINSYSYDAEGRILTVNGNTYVYDGMGNRVKKTVSGTVTLYWAGVNGWVIDESNSTASTMAKQIYFAGILVWRESVATGDGIFLFQDQLNSTHLTADASGNVKDNVSFYPYGQKISYSSTTTDNHYGFAGYEEDGDSDYAVFRNLNTINWGRFNRPDPYGGSYDPTNPQSFNRYAYVGNRPLSALDPLGLMKILKCGASATDCPGGDTGSGSSGSGGCFFTYVNYGVDINDGMGTTWQGTDQWSGWCPSGVGFGTANGLGYAQGPQLPSTTSTAPNNQPSKLHSCVSKTWAATNKTGLALDAAGAILTLAAPEASPLIGLASSLIGSASAYQSFNQGVSVSNIGAGTVSLGGAAVSSIAPSAHLFAGASSFTASLKSVGRGFAEPL